MLPRTLSNACVYIWECVCINTPSQVRKGVLDLTAAIGGGCFYSMIGMVELRDQEEEGMTNHCTDSDYHPFPITLQVMGQPELKCFVFGFETLLLVVVLPCLRHKRE